jgi:predicted phosphoribosyltransferase
VVLAVPVGAPEAYAVLTRTADEVVCPERPADFGAVSRFYNDFHEVSDEEVVALLTGPR